MKIINLIALIFQAGSYIIRAIVKRKQNEGSSDNSSSRQ